MCVYKNDKFNYLKESINSILNQEGVVVKLYIFVDGYVDKDIIVLLNGFNKLENVDINYSERNVGLASGLNWLLDNVVDFDNYKYVARMDADDISRKDRFYEQSLKLSNSDIDVLGSDCIEIDGNNNESFYKKLPQGHDDLICSIIKRCPFIHPSVMFKSSVFIDGYRYDSSLMNTQDYYLWVTLAKNGYKFGNINKPLIYFRVDSNFHKRRGFKKVLNEIRGRLWAMNELSMYSIKNLFFIFAYLVLRLSPSFVSQFAYKKLR